MSAEKALARALGEVFAEHGAIVIVEEAASRPWASATFSGAHHVIVLQVSGPAAAKAAAAVLPGLAEREFALPGHVLVDIACEGEERTADGVRLTLAALTVEAD